jgi:hypothetical protein
MYNNCQNKILSPLHDINGGLGDERNSRDFRNFLARKYKNKPNALQLVYQFNGFLRGEIMTDIDTSQMTDQMFNEAQLMHIFQQHDNERRKHQKITK